MSHRRIVPKAIISKKAQRIARPPPGPLQAARERANETGADFPVGGNYVYLPNILVTLLHKPTLPPTHAQFRVPLRFNKLDLRDYLWHAYGLRTSSIRSSIARPSVRQVERGSKRDVPGRKTFYQPQGIKKMTVRLDRPFVWPEDQAPQDDVEATDRRVYNAQKEYEMRAKERKWRDAHAELGYARKIAGLTRVAEELQLGEEKWKGNGEGGTRAAGDESQQGNARSEAPKPPSPSQQAHEERVGDRAKFMRASKIRPARQSARCWQSALENAV